MTGGNDALSCMKGCRCGCVTFAYLERLARATTQTAARILWLRYRLAAAAAADAQAVRILVCTTRAGAGATRNAHVTLLAAHGIADWGEVVILSHLFHRRTQGREGRIDRAL